MRAVQVTCHQIVHVSVVWHRFVSATRPVLMTRVVAATIVIRRAAVRIGGTHVQRMFINVVLVREMQVPVVEVIDVLAMDDGGMTAVGAVNMGMAFVSLMIDHKVSPEIGLITTTTYVSVADVRQCAEIEIEGISVYRRVVSDPHLHKCHHLLIGAEFPFHSECNHHSMERAAPPY